MKKNAMGNRAAAVLCVALLFSHAAPAATAEELVTLIAPGGDALSQTLVENQEKKNEQSEGDSSADAVLIEPVTLVEPITQVTPVEPAAPVYSQIDAQVTTGEDSITIKIVEASSEAMYAAVGDDFKMGLHKGDSAVFSGLAAGTYDIEVDYENGSNVFRTSATIEAADPQPEAPPTTGGAADPITPVTPVVPEAPVYSQIDAQVTTGEDSITIKIVEASSEAMYAAVGDDFKMGLHKGDSAVFSGLAAGTYDIEVDYENGSNVFRTSATIEAADPQPEAPPTTGGATELITPPTSGGAADLVTPPTSGDTTELVTPVTPPTTGGMAELVTPVTPPTAGGTTELVTPVTPPTSSSTAESVTPPSSGSSQEEVKTFILVPVVAQAGVSAVIDGASSREIEIALLDQAGKTVASSAIIGNGLVTLGEFASGTYTIRAQYVTPVQKADGSYDFKTVTAQAIVQNGLAQQPAQEAPVNIQARIEKGSNSIIIVVTEANDRDMMVSVDGLGDKKITKGAWVSYEGLTPGNTYHIQIDYIDYVPGTNVFKQSVTLEKPAEPEKPIEPEKTEYPTLEKGDRGYALIYTLQQRLKDLGYYTIKVDGIFGSGTKRAVREFQRVNGLSVTGVADHTTQTLLYSSAAKHANSGVVVPTEYKTLSRSSKYKSAVVPLQKRLKALGYYSGNIDGYFGSQTYRAVRNFQNRNGLSVTGVADPYTQQVLYSASAKTYSGSTASSGSTSSGYRLLYWGCRGDAVKRLQKALIEAGYKKIVRTADGIFGQWTYDAVRAYQKDHGLAVDGIAGKNTQNALYGTRY